MLAPTLRYAPRSGTHPVVAADHSGQSRSAIAGTSGLWIGRRFWRLTSPAKGRCPSAHAGVEGLAAGRDAFTIERGHPTLPLHRPCGRSPSPWQGRFCPGPSFRPAPHPPAMHPRRGGHWPSAVTTSKHNTPMQIRKNPTGYVFASACCILGNDTADERCSTVRWTVLYFIPQLRLLCRRNWDPQPPPLHGRILAGADFACV